jgi:hypothetical protein
MHRSNAFLNEENIKTGICLQLDNNQLDTRANIRKISFEPQTRQEQERFSKEFINCDLGHLQLLCLGSLDVHQQ